MAMRPTLCSESKWTRALPRGPPPGPPHQASSPSATLIWLLNLLEGLSGQAANLLL
jgi:hypothetical protein